MKQNCFDMHTTNQYSVAVDFENYKQTHYLACKARARRLILGRIKIFAFHFQKPIYRVSVKNMVSRWGSCSSKGNLNFNYRILFLPLELVDYIIVHELSHLHEMNHGRNFWRMVGRIIPNYREHIRALRLLEKTLLKPVIRRSFYERMKRLVR